MTERKLEVRGPITKEELREFIMREDIDDINKFLVINGGTGLRKTNSILINAKDIIKEKTNESVNMLLVQSRTITVEQIEERYNEQIETFGGITVKQRIAFMNMIENGEIENYNWVVIDECHGLFSEASFAEDASYIANWIRCGRTKQHVIFITANDEFFLQAGQYYYGESEFSQLFKDMRFYFSPTYVEYAHYIVTNKTHQRLASLLNSLRGKKGLVFLQHASAAFDWCMDFLDNNIEAGFIVSLGNETTTALSKAQETLLQKLNIDFSGGQANWTLAQLERSMDTGRTLRGLKPIRSTLIKEASIPEDIEVLFATDTLQEGVSIISHLDYIIIEGYTEVEVRQKLGRYRNVLKDLYIIFNPSQATTEFDIEEQTFSRLFKLQEEGNQGELAEQYALERSNRWETRHVNKIIKDGKSYYEVNEAAYRSFLTKQQRYKELGTGREYMRKILNPYVKDPEHDIILLEAKDFKEMDEKEALKPIILKWAEKPLIGYLAEELFEDLESYGITDSKGKKIDTIRKFTNILNRHNIPTKRNKISQKLLRQYPNLKEISEKWYTYINVCS